LLCPFCYPHRFVEYRSSHGNAPRPDVPSRGVVVVSSDDSFWATFSKRREETPLRLLVIGDSLAAGVGVSESSTPILPESIAQSLSKAMDGRAVYWTCVGTPGTSASEIVQEIHHLEDLPTPLIQQLADFQAESRQRAHERIQAAKRKALSWWQIHQQPVDEPNNSSNAVIRWFQRKAAQIQRDVRELRHVLEVDPDEQQEERLSHRQSTARKLARRQTLDPAVVGKYDIAVVLTGLNDLKDTFLPFMMSRERAKNLKQAQKENDHENGLKAELVRVVQALKNKMKNYLPAAAAKSTDDRHLERSKESLIEEKRIARNRHGPLVVFPALPIAPLAISRLPPLCWFLVPLIRGIDRNKQVLAEMYPELVLFVESPTLEAFSEAEDKRGPLWEDFKKEKVHFQLTDIAQNVRERVEELMKQHYQSWIYDAEDEDDGYYVIEADSVSHTHEFRSVRIHDKFGD